MCVWQEEKVSNQRCDSWLQEEKKQLESLWETWNPHPQVSSGWFSNDVDLFEFCRVGVSIHEDTRCRWEHWWETWHLLTQERDFDFEVLSLFVGMVWTKKVWSHFLTFVGHLRSLLIEKNLSFHMVVLNVTQKTAAEIMYCQIWCIFICSHPFFKYLFFFLYYHISYLFSRFRHPSDEQVCELCSMILNPVLFGSPKAVRRRRDVGEEVTIKCKM